MQMRGKRIQLDDETWQALDLLSRDSMKTFQELTDEAFDDLLKKYGRPTDLKTAPKRSIQSAPSAPSRRPRHPSRPTPVHVPVHGAWALGHGVARLINPTMDSQGAENP
jgi:hypothetical protein